MNEYLPGTWVHFLYQEDGGKYIILCGKIIGICRHCAIAQCQYWTVARYLSRHLSTFFEVWQEDILDDKEAEEWKTQNSYGNYG